MLCHDFLCNFFHFFSYKYGYIKINCFSKKSLLDERNSDLISLCALKNANSMQEKNIYLKFNTRKNILCHPPLPRRRGKKNLFYFLFGSDISDESICFSQFIFVASLILCSITWLRSIDIFFGVSGHISRIKLRPNLGTECRCLLLYI